MNLAFWKKPSSSHTKRKRLALRAFEGSIRSRLNSWRPAADDINSDIQHALSDLRAISRDFYQNNDLVKRYVQLIKTHVVGPKGVALQCLFKNSKGDLDHDINDALENAFRKWGKKGSPEVTRKHSWLAIQHLVVTHLVRDGEAFIRLVRNSKQNHFGFALQLLNPSACDDRLNVIPQNNDTNPVVMGIEIDRLYGFPVSYFFKTTAKGEGIVSFRGNQYLKIPANEMIHVFDSLDASQVRGIPWIHTGIRRLRQLSGYEYAELVKMRVQASSMGFFTRTVEDYERSREDGEDDKDDSVDGAIVQSASPGSFEVLPPGMDFKSWNPDGPPTQYRDYVKSQIRGIAAGLGVSYNSLAQDLEGVNFSSLRSGLLEERDFYKQSQEYLIESFYLPVYSAWLETSTLTGAVPIRAKDIDKYSTPTFLPRRWAWVDPLKDTKSAVEGIAAGIKSRREIAQEQGRSIEDIFLELKREKDLAEKLGLNFDKDNAPEPRKKSNSSKELIDAEGE